MLRERAAEALVVAIILLALLGSWALYRASELSQKCNGGLGTEKELP